MSITMWMGGTGAAQAFPGDGDGSISTIQAGGTSSATTTFTKTTVTDVGATLSGSFTAGMLVTCATGEWGVITAYDNVGLVITVDTWRKKNPGQLYVQTGVTPAANTIVRVYGASCIGKLEKSAIIQKVVFTAAVAAATLAITDPGGTAIPGLTWTIPATPGLVTSDFSGFQLGGIKIPQLFGYKASAATTSAVIEFSTYV